ncbi:MAG: hypothetical protein LBS91_06600 [Clostridiales Family XIII bacterium]|jgi:hypothetical protein|nr:hypothetical protein [Clostridiales Family XIII bacterium]
MKKAITLALALVLALSLLAACGGKGTGTGSAGGSGSAIPASSDEYRRGMNLLQEEKYEEAVAAFTEAIANGSNLCDQALFARDIIDRRETACGWLQE